MRNVASKALLGILLSSVLLTSMLPVNALGHIQPGSETSASVPTSSAPSAPTSTPVAPAPVDIALATFHAIGVQPFIGDPVKPTVRLTYEGTTLREGTDFVLAFDDNTQVGTATITASGIGDYFGVATQHFQIANLFHLDELDAAIDRVERLDAAEYTAFSMNRLLGYLAQAKAVQAKYQAMLDAGTAVLLDDNQPVVDDTVRLLNAGYAALEVRFGPATTVVVGTSTANVYAEASTSSKVLLVLSRAATATAQIDRDATDAWWYHIPQVGYVCGSDVFSFPVLGVGDPYKVVCLKVSVSGYQYPRDWANRVSSYPQSTEVTVTTVDDTWVVASVNTSPTPSYVYLRARDVKPVNGSYPATGTPANPTPPISQPDTNAADPAASNPETRSSDTIGFGESGGGGRKESPVTATAWWPGANTTGIDRLERFWIRFSQNVADAGLVAHNVTLITLRKADGTIVPSRVYALPISIYLNARRYIYIAPDRPLDWGTRYYIEALAGIGAHNGKTTVVTYTIPFSTESYPYTPGDGLGPPQPGPTGGGIGFGTGFEQPGSGGSGSGTDTSSTVGGGSGSGSSGGNGGSGSGSGASAAPGGKTSVPGGVSGSSKGSGGVAVTKSSSVGGWVMSQVSDDVKGIGSSGVNGVRRGPSPADSALIAMAALLAIYAVGIVWTPGARLASRAIGRIVGMTISRL